MATSTSIPFNKSAKSTPQQFKSNDDNVDPSVDISDNPRDVLVRILPFDIMADTLFPSISSTQVGEVLQMLRTKGNIEFNGWTAFNTLSSPEKNARIYEPRHSSEGVEVTFKGLEQVFEGIVQAHASLRKGPIDDLSLGIANGIKASLESVEGNEASLIALSIYGNGSLAGDWPDRTRPDGSTHLKKTCLPWPRVTKVDPKENSHVVVDCADVCLMIEAKLRMSPGDVDENRSKLLCNAHHKLRSDPRCRFVTGITVENTRMQFWYFDRAGILVSAPFDFTREPQKLIHILLGYIIAPSEDALGFDTTIHVPEYSKVPKPKEDSARVYEIGVHDSSSGVTTVFRTIRCLVNFGAMGICGRGTRVWEVVKVDAPDSERTYVLKDVWIDEDEDPTTEATRLRQIHDQALPEALQFFLEVDCHGAVLTRDLGLLLEDKTLKYPIPAAADPRTMLIQYVAPAQRLATITDTSTNSGTSASASTSSRAAVHSSRSSGSGASTGIMEGFITASNGFCMTADDAHPCTPSSRLARRRHYRIAFTDPPGCSIRDLTLPEDGFKALHGGLKAMKAMLRQGLMHRDISAGNILLIERGGEKVGILMDLEYAKEFPGDSNRPHAVRTGTPQFMAVEVLSLTYMFQPRRKQYKLGWSHNPLHDVESTWWIAVWILYYRADIGLSDDDKHHRAKLFSIADTQARSIFFQYNNTGEGFLKKLPVTISKILDDWRIALLMFYEEQQADLEHGSHELFNYDRVVTDAIGRIESIRTALIDLPVCAG